MNIEEFREYCLNKKGVTESFPFDERALVFKVSGKIFAVCDVDTFESVNLKCDPEKAVKLREEFPDSVFPGYHMNKKHWNTVKTDGSVPSTLLAEWINHSYDSVVKKLPLKLRKKLIS